MSKLEQLEQLRTDILTELSKKYIKEKTCICCGLNKITPFYHEGINPVEQDTRCCWSGGAVQKISFGYGSKFDLDSFFIAICDNCIETMVDKKLVESVNDMRKEIGDSLIEIDKTDKFTNELNARRRK